MQYIKSLDIPANTTKINPSVETVKVWHGVIHSIDVFIPPGHTGLARLQIFLGGSIIYPTNEDGYISGDNTIVPGKFFIDIGRGVSLLTFRGWNIDDTYSHEFIIRVGVLPKWVLIPQIMISKALEFLTRVFVG